MYDVEQLTCQYKMFGIQNTLYLLIVVIYKTVEAEAYSLANVMSYNF